MGCIEHEDDIQVLDLGCWILHSFCFFFFFIYSFSLRKKKKDLDGIRVYVAFLGATQNNIPSWIRRNW